MPPIQVMREFIILTKWLPKWLSIKTTKQILINVVDYEIQTVGGRRSLKAVDFPLNDVYVYFGKLMVTFFYNVLKL